MDLKDITKSSREQFEIDSKYKVYLERQKADIENFKSDESLSLPKKLDYSKIGSLSNEVVEKLSLIRPTTIGAASRISGVTPAAIIALLRFVKNKNNKAA